MNLAFPSALPIQPLSAPLSASIRVPGSKSLTNRALMIAALANGTTRLINALFSDDTLYFVESLRRLGFTVLLEPKSEESQPEKADTIPAMTVSGLGGCIPAKQADLYVGNAGTAARFLMALLTLGHGTYTLDGDARMRQRPMQDLRSALEKLGAVITHPHTMDQFTEAGVPCTNLPMCVQASGLSGGCADIAGDASSQFLSGLLLAAPYAQHPVELKVERGLSSKPFVDLTLAVMAEFGVRVARVGYERFSVFPQCYQSPGTYIIECDATAASYFLAAPAICGGTVRVEGISRNSRQGDLAFLDILAQMGCRVADGSDWVSVTCSQASLGYPSLQGVDVDMNDISDTAQTLAVVAPFASTPTFIRGIASARYKETDRVSAICTELTRLGVHVDEYPDGLTIYPCRDYQPGCIQTYQDHRMAMAFSLIGLKVPGISIFDPGCVSKTFPDFFEVFDRLYS